ncbi:MAG: AAA family ATPase [Verrucomicrobiaceae bacterium]
MRIASLDLIRYGRFENTEIPFARGASDFQIIVGPNEAGKTTIRAAISDLLFGFEHNAPYGYRFDNPMLRVGATLEGDGIGAQQQGRHLGAE